MPYIYAHFKTLIPCSIALRLYLPPEGVTSFQGMHVGGGTRRPGVISVEACVAVCALTSDCLGFDFDTRDDSCWLHTSQTVCTTFREKQFCTHYRMVACSTTTGGVT